MSFSGPLKDRLELRELLDAYADAVCQNNPDDWGLCWAKDGVWSMPDYEQFPDQTGPVSYTHLTLPTILLV